MILELRATAGQLFTTMKETNAAIADTAAKTEVREGRMQAAFNKTAVVGKGLALGLGVAAVAVAAISTKMAVDFQAKMTLLQTAAGESKSNISKVSDGILNLAGATGTSVDQLSEGMYTIEKAGIRGADGLKVLKAAAEGAKSENVDLATATNALTSVMMSYHLKAGDAVKVQNELVAGSGMAKTTMQEYAGSLSAVIPVASAAHISFAQVGGAIATLTQHGTSANESTQELANTIRNLQAPSQVAQKAMQQIGLGVNDVSSKLGSRGLTGTIDLITKAITSKMGPSGLIFVDAMKKSQSATQDMHTMLSKMPASLAELSTKFMNGQIGMKEYQQAFKNLGGTGYSMGAQFLQLSKATQGFNQLLTSGQPGAATFSKYLKDIMGGATGMNTALMLGGENMTYFKKATDDVSAAARKGGSNISTWAKTQATLKVQLDQAGESIAAMGVRLGTALIPVLSKALKGTEGFVGYLSSHQGVLWTIVGIIGGAMVLAIGTYVTKLTIAGVKTVIQFGKMVASAVAWSVSTAIQFGKAVAAGAVWVAQSSVQFVQWMAKQAAVLSSTAAMWTSFYGPRMAAWVAKSAAAFASMMAKGAVWVATTAVQLAANAIQWTIATSKTVGALAVQSAAIIAQKAIMVGSAIAIGVVTAAQWLWNAAMDANPIGIIIVAIAALVAAIIWLVANWKTVSKFLTDTWQNVASFFTTVGTAISTWWNGFWNGLISFAQGVFKNGFNFISSILNSIIDAVNTITAGINAVGGSVGISLHIGKIPHLPSFDVGIDRVPGASGTPMVATIHGGEAILSNDMLSGRAQIPDRVTQAVSTASSRSSVGQAPSSVDNSRHVTIMATTNATPTQIASSVGWTLRRMG
jgi:hypothetical protein